MTLVFLIAGVTLGNASTTAPLMPYFRDLSRGQDRIVLLLLFGLLLFVSPFAAWWAADDSPWYLPYLAWALVIALTAVHHLRRDRHEL